MCVKGQDDFELTRCLAIMALSKKFLMNPLLTT